MKIVRTPKNTTFYANKNVMKMSSESPKYFFFDKEVLASVFALLLISIVIINWKAIVSVFSASAQRHGQALVSVQQENTSDHSEGHVLTEITSVSGNPQVLYTDTPVNKEALDNVITTKSDIPMIEGKHTDDNEVIDNAVNDTRLIDAFEALSNQMDIVSIEQDISLTEAKLVQQVREEIDSLSLD